MRVHFLISQEAWRKVVGSIGSATHLCQALCLCWATFGLLSFVCLMVTSWSLKLQIMYYICLKERIEKGEAAWLFHLSLFILSLSADFCLQQTWLYVVSHGCKGGWESKYFTWGQAPGCLKGNWYPVSKEGEGTGYGVGIWQCWPQTPTIGEWFA